MSRAFWITVAVVIALFGLGYALLLTKMSAGLATLAVHSSATDPLFRATQTVTDANNGSTVSLVAGETVAIKLETHSGGGYQYSLDAFDRSILRLADHRTINPSSTDANGRQIVGASTLEQWTFTALFPGTTSVELTNFRPFEPRPAKPTFTVAVVVE